MTGMSTNTGELLKLATAVSSDNGVDEIKIISSPPDWTRFESSGLIPSGSAKTLSQLHSIDMNNIRTILNTYPEILNLIPLVLSNIAAEILPSQYLLTVLSEACRVDATVWDMLGKKAAKTDMFTPFTILLGRPTIDTFVADKAIQVLTSIMSHAPDGAYSIQQVKLVCSGLISGQFKASQVGVLDGLSNLLKRDAYRAAVFEVFGTLERIFAVSVETPAALYKSLFCIWVASFNDDVLGRIFAKRADSLVALLSSTFEECRVEKILRIALSVVKNVLSSPTISEAIVESGLVHAIQPLEYEKWRDNELYDEIRSVASRVVAETAKHSNFERYEKELHDGQLRRGFIHSEKFWLDNVSNFERDNFAPVARLIALLNSNDAITQAVACHDLGEFARLHPSGKRVVNKLNGKGAVMALMTSSNREVAKEALLCTQKLMLNNWDKLSTTGSSVAPQVKVK
jgi:V-type H+-transporting ATPase subunit H